VSAPATHWSTRDFAEISEGEKLPEHTVAITLQRLVMEASANRDFAPIHFERAAAQATGAPDVYANTIFLETVLESAIRRWAGLGGRITEIAFSMRSFNCVGDLVSAGGTVVSLDPQQRLAELDIWIESPQRGRTVEGSATVRFQSPDSSSGGNGADND
jgi:acyl dehydratase